VSIVRGSPVNWVFKGPVLISFNQPGAVPPERWAAFVRSMTTTQFNYCIGTGLGAIEVNSLQRKDASKALKGKRVVVVVDHAVARGIVTALSWLGLSIKGYDWDRLDDAVKFLELPSSVNHNEVVQAVLDLRDASLSVDNLKLRK
jgi:hypothetical protein